VKQWVSCWRLGYKNDMLEKSTTPIVFEQQCNEEKTNYGDCIETVELVTGGCIDSWVYNSFHV
jgi:hypothetical protein